MKNRSLATIVTLLLLIGSLGFTFSFKVSADPVTYYWLTIDTNPASLYTWPSPPRGNHTAQSWINVTAPAIIDIGPSSRAVFQSWTGGDGISGTYSVWAWMTSNKTITANYKIQHKLTVESLYAPVWISNGSWYQTSESWIDEYTIAFAGVSGLFGAPPGVYVNPDQWAYLVNWTGDASGKHLSGVLPANGYYSDPINMTGPKTAVALWAYQYKLCIFCKNSSVVAPPPFPPSLNPPVRWLEECSLVNLTAPDPHPTWNWPGSRRYVFDYWEVDGVMQTPANVNLTVHMDTNHTATVFYKRQSWIILADNIGNQSGFADAGNWYDSCKNYTFSTPQYIYLSSGIRYDFRFWELVGTGNIGTINPITLHITPVTFDGVTLTARYQTQYYLGVSSSGSTVPNYLYPDSDTSGWYDAGTTVNLKAKPLVSIDSTSRYVFVQWKNHLGGTNANNNISFAMMQPWNVTAEYDLEYLAKWDYSPTTITIPGWPGQAWIKKGIPISYGAPNNDASGQFVFHYWVIDGVTYAAGLNPVDLGPMTGPIYGTANYANKTKLFMTPPNHEETAHAWCNEFDVTIYAANFDANREVSGKPMDIYGFDMIIDFNPALLEITNVDLELDDFFAPNDYFIAINQIDNTAGTYQLVATVKGNYTGFEGTKAIFTVTFHVIYDPCYPNQNTSWITFSYAKLMNHLDQRIYPELGNQNCKYKITTVKPMLEIRDAATGGNTITVHKNAPQQTTFDVEVWLLHGVKVHDYYVVVDYDPTQIEAFDVVISNYLKPPFIIYAWWISVGAGKVYVQVAQETSVPLQNCSGLLFTISFKVVDEIFYTIPGPHHLTSDITIDYAELSVKCPNPFLQKTTDGNLGSIKATYIYNPCLGDLDYDGCVTVLDLQLIAQNYGPTAIYDITGDGKTDIADLVFVALRFGTCL